MKRPLTILTALLLSFGPAAQALLNLGEGQVDLSVQSSLYYDSEIRASNSGLEDTVFTLRPTLTYLRPSRNWSFSASAGVLLQRYFDHSTYDDEDVFFDLQLAPGARLETSRFRLSGNILLNTETRSDEAAGDIVTTRNYGISGELVYDPNRNYNVVADVNAHRRDTESAFYDDQDTYGGGLKLQVPIRKPGLFAEAGIAYEHLSSDQSTALDSDTYTYFVGLNGPLTARINGSLSVGMQDRRFDEGGSDSAPYASAALEWTIDELTRASLTGSKSFGSTVTAQSSESTSAELSLNRQLNREWSLSGNIGYRESSYDSFGIGPASRDDEEAFAGVRLTHQLVRWGSIALYANYSDRSSDIAFFDYDRFQGGLSFTGRW